MWITKSIILDFVLISCCLTLESAEEEPRWLSIGGDLLPLEEISLSAPELILKNGYPFESHVTSTADGYLLTLHRISSPGKPVVLMFHGMFGSSRDFLMNRKHKAPAYKMFDGGFDVWLVNSRGNLYSNENTHLSNDDPEFWDFSVDEVIKYDAPAMIDYILEYTGQSKLNWIGYSLGTAVGMGLMSVHPQYNYKLNFLIMMGTTAYVGNSISPLLRILAPAYRLQDVIMTTLNHGEVLPPFLFPVMRTIFPLLCLPEAVLNTPGPCAFFLFIIAGFNPEQANMEFLPILLGGTPGSLAIKMLSQWYQWIACGQFSYYDYGFDINLWKYGSVVPPTYNLSSVTTRVINLWAQNDWLSVPQDVQRTVSELPNVTNNIRIRMDTWNHLDFIYGKDADRFVYTEIIYAINLSTRT